MNYSYPSNNKVEQPPPLPKKMELIDMLLIALAVGGVGGIGIYLFVLYQKKKKSASSSTASKRTSGSTFSELKRRMMVPKLKVMLEGTYTSITLTFEFVDATNLKVYNENTTSGMKSTDSLTYTETSNKIVARVPRLGAVTPLPDAYWNFSISASGQLLYDKEGTTFTLIPS